MLSVPKQISRSRCSNLQPVLIRSQSDLLDQQSSIQKRQPWRNRLACGIALDMGVHEPNRIRNLGFSIIEYHKVRARFVPAATKIVHRYEPTNSVLPSVPDNHAKCECDPVDGRYNSYRSNFAPANLEPQRCNPFTVVFATPYFARLGQHPCTIDAIHQGHLVRF